MNASETDTDSGNRLNNLGNSFFYPEIRVNPNDNDEVFFGGRVLHTGIVPTQSSAVTKIPNQDKHDDVNILSLCISESDDNIVYHTCPKRLKKCDWKVTPNLGGSPPTKSHHESNAFQSSSQTGRPQSFSTDSQ